MVLRGEHDEVEPLADVDLTQGLAEEGGRQDDLGQLDLLRGQLLDGQVLVLELQVAAAAQLRQPLGLALDEQPVALADHRLGVGRRAGPALALDPHHRQAEGRAQAALAQGLAGQPRALRHRQAEKLAVEAVELAEVALPRRTGAAGGEVAAAVGQQLPPHEGHEEDPRQHHRETDGGEVEELEGGLAVRALGLGDQQVGRRADEGGQAAQEGAVGQGDQQLGGRVPGPAGDVHHHGQQQRRHPDVVHEGRHRACGDHHGEQQRHLAGAGQTHDVAPQEARHPGPLQPPAEDEDRPHRDDGGVAEAGKGLLGLQQPGERQGQQHHQRHDVHSHPLAHEEDDGAHYDGENEADLEGQDEVPAAIVGIVAKAPEAAEAV
ncbi:MAG: hypothetical protein R3325_03760 [Thermoanaerobaculia bacterium]|nr:hypothetical protein [Thermoanaerobaculia bacterium]